MGTKLEGDLQKSGRKYQMALDLVEPGNDDINSYGKQERVSKDLPSGVNSSMLYKDVVRIAWPSFVELILTQLASMIDMMMVGKLGPWAITSVGLTTQPKFLLMAAFMAMNVGATALVARYKGEGNYGKANAILRQALILTFTLSALASFFGFIFSEQLILFMGASETETLVGGSIYLKIQMVGFVILALTSTLTATLRGVGDSRTAMVYNLIANIVNVVFNYLLIFGNIGFPRMGIAGASLATIIGQGVAFIIALTVIMRGNRVLKLSLRDNYKPNWNMMKSIFKIGIPAMIEQLVMRTGVIIYVKTVASLGTVAYATHQVCLNIQGMSFMNGQAFAVSATSLVGQSLGKKRPDMAQAYSTHTRRIGMVVSLIFASVLFFFRESIVALYTDDFRVIEQGAKILMFVAFIQPFQASQFILAGALRGAGDTRATAAIMLITVLLVRPILAIWTINGLGWGLNGAWVAFVSDQLLRSLLVLMRYKSGKWKNIKV